MLALGKAVETNVICCGVIVEQKTVAVKGRDINKVPT